MSLPKTTERVPQHTAEEANRDIAKQAEARVAEYALNPKDIRCRIDELDAEWDIERVLEANAATASLIGVVLGATVDRRFYVVPGIVAGFLLQHALQGWCPPLPVFRRLGFRTQSEIAQERYALKALRGDFEHIHRREQPTAALQAARA